MKRIVLSLLAALAAVAQPVFAAADKPLIIENGQTKQLPSATGIQLQAATTGNASLNIPQGTAPTSPSNGDIWTDINGLYVRTNGVTRGPVSNGTVTSIDVSGGTTGLTTSGGPVTSSGTITLAGTLAVANGGCGATTASGCRINLGLGIGTDIADLSYIRLDSDYTLTSTTSAQQLFNTTPHGRLTLATGVYRFRALIMVASMSATSGNAAFDLLGAGSATLAGQLMIANGRDATGATTPSIMGGAMQQGSSAFPGDILVAGTATGMTAEISGMFKVTVAGTIVPSIALTTATAAVMKTGSFIQVERIGDLGTNNKGPWD